MASSNRRPSISVSSAPGKRAASESAPTKAPAITGKKRVALGDVSNVRNAGRAVAGAPAKTVTVSVENFESPFYQYLFIVSLPCMN